MKRALPRLRLAGLALPLLLGGCMSGVLPGADAPDPSCVLLCALTREITGAPAAQPMPVAAVTPSRPILRRSAARTHRRLPKAPDVAVAASPRRRAATLAHRRPIHHRPVAEVSVVPQASALLPAQQPVALAPVRPAAVATASPPLAPARSLNAAIPGSAGIMTPAWRDP
ncbi:hypothetical protein P7D22_20160 [Lichenihabitans sp. Uapishka_5]|uniref:hypothetical protein n=1 Tax=Lichenihabitans sp. Uapishka_5 TaxID=3037302 RepID=UPI0029E7FB77|nr:hypothetical protein [Lichenihabitans sp. Uapishka_5]MDX7953483.1 hypothetical protein [Lichenihabitans sp. Uapishka_5]